MEKKMKACEMFYIYAEIFQADFFPWIKEITLAVAPLFEGGQLLRRRAISATLQLLRSAEVAVESGIATNEDMKDVSRELHASLVGVMDREGEAKFAEILKEATERALEFAES
ncbi:uncharacterized protein LOC130495440 [Raphanus sativus]|uniref:Uncharacterized protein LOC130495440 n=1 Tax=Raphanus sativus TaxID=3726 RepID=A0A9W3BU87_RAPSA|nr:uncharacterized protein LOC130495440 [Raphanus sativus]